MPPRPVCGYGNKLVLAPGVSRGVRKQAILAIADGRAEHVLDPYFLHSA